MPCHGTALRIDGCASTLLGMQQTLNTLPEMVAGILKVSFRC